MRQLDVSIGDILLHKKGGYYKVLTHCAHSETDEHLIVYIHITSGNVWARPKEMFTSDRFTVAIRAEDLKQTNLDS